MKFRCRIRRVVKIRPEILEEKVITYLTNNSYRVTEKGSGYIIFIEDGFSDRRKSKSDFHTRIGEGKFLFSHSMDNETTSLELIYFTSLAYYVVLVMLVCAFGIYTNNVIMPIVFSIILTMPIFYKIIYLNGHVFDEILEC